MTEAAAQKLRDQARRSLAVLTSREEQVLRLRFGIDQPTHYTAEEISERLSITRERIRQIEITALRKLRHPEGNELRRVQ